MTRDILPISLTLHGILTDCLVEYEADGPDASGVVYLERIVTVDRGQFVDPAKLDPRERGRVEEACWQHFCDERDKHQEWLKLCD